MANTRFIVMSDSHGDDQVVQAIKNHYLGKVDAIFHNGDSELMATDPIWEGIAVVAGNCDLDQSYPETLISQVKGVRIAQTHGHLHGINFSWDRLVYFAEEAEAEICLYGHLHRADAWQESGIVFINPGSVLQPRGPIMEKLYALVTVDETSIQVDYYDLNHQCRQDLHKEFQK